MRASNDFRRSRLLGASKITPHERYTLLQSFVEMLQIFEDHFNLSERFSFSNRRDKPAPTRSLIYFASFQEISNRIAETITQSHANQFPKRE